ncbi:(Fe-S)-binding protein [Chloroflexi bacterium]|nr:(Fe-S)-binding protein [Chloroflexota bacterium]
MPNKVSLFATCVLNNFYPEVAISAARVLNRLGVEVTVEPTQTCCGQPFFNSGHWSDSSKLVRKFVSDYSDCDTDIVLPSGSCTSMIRNHYMEVCDRNDVGNVEYISTRTFEFTEYITRKLGICDLSPFQSESAEMINVTYHESCHLNRELGISKEPISLLKSLKNIILINMNQSEVCCGFGGTFSTKYPEISTAMAEEKIANVKQSGAEVVTASDMSCLMHMDGLMTRKNLDIKSLHIAQLIDLAMGMDDKK